MNRLLATLGLLIALAAGGVLAQPQAGSPAGDTVEKPEKTAQPAETDTSSGALESTAPGARDGAAATTGSEPAGSEDSPFDYQASEQISEDLSVSFPVDI